MRCGGSRDAIERFSRFVAGDANWEGLDPERRQRVCASADTYFEIERGTITRLDHPVELAETMRPFLRALSRP